VNKTGSHTKKENLICSCCKERVYDSNLTKTLGRRVWLWGTMTTLQRNILKNGRFQWACDNCLNAKKALIAQPEAQLYCDFDPYLAYFDIDKTCETCNTPYVFTKEEQKHWYESLKFWVQSKPKNCLKCRGEIRESRKLNNELSELLKDKEKLTVRDMVRLSEIYDEIKKPDKSKYYDRLARKANRMKKS